jgi:Asp/Glu/hydantoin racemase
MSRPTLLLVNPNSTGSMTAELSRIYSGIAPASLSFIDGSSIQGCPPAIENQTQSVISAALLLPLILSHIADSPVDGILVCCFSDHPLVPILRENVDVPVLGIFHASLQAASMLDRKFGIVTTAMAWQPILTASVQAAGAHGSSAGVIATGLGVLELESRPQDEVLRRIEECTSTLIERGASCIVLGCAGMAPLEKLLNDILPNEIKIIDGVRYGIHFLAALASI